MKKAKNGFARGAITLCVFLMVGKVIGAVYRLPLTYILGSEGIGIYQMIFPLYSLLLTISSSAVPQALSKLISEKQAKGDHVGAKQIFRVATIWLIIFSFVCTAIILIACMPISRMQGNAQSYICYLGIAPSIIFVGVISAYKGYFQGQENMVPSGVASLIEQVVKMVAGLLLAYLFMPNGVLFGVFGALLGVSISEFVAAIYLAVRYIITKPPRKIVTNGLNFKSCSKALLSICLPVTLGALILPLVQFIDSGLVVKLLTMSGYSQQEATSLFGLSSGAVGSLVNLPVVLSLSVATAVLPSISKSNVCGNEQRVKSTINKSFMLTILLTLPCVFGLFMLSRPIISFLYGGVFSKAEIEIASYLLKIGAVSCLFLALTQVSSGILQGKGNFKTPMFALLVGGVFKIIANIVLIKVPQINIYGDQIANLLCFLAAFLVNISFIAKQITAATYRDILKILIASIVMSGFISLFIYFVDVNNFWLLATSIICAVMVYFSTLIILFYNKSNKKEW